MLDLNPGCPTSKTKHRAGALTPLPSLLLKITIFPCILLQLCMLFRRCISIRESATVDGALIYVFLFSSYFDHDAFMHHALHVLNAPAGSCNYFLLDRTN